MPAYTNAVQVIPELFKQIIRNDKERAELKAQSVIPFDKASALIAERRDYTRQAEKKLSWNVDKGNRK